MEQIEFLIEGMTPETPEQIRKNRIIDEYGDVLSLDLIDNLRKRKWNMVELDWLEKNCLETRVKYANKTNSFGRYSS